MVPQNSKQTIVGVKPSSYEDIDLTGHSLLLKYFYYRQHASMI